MRKFNLKFFLTFGLVGVALSSEAQLHPLTFPDPNPPATGAPTDNWYKDYVGVQLTVTDPAAISGPLIYTAARDGNTGDWGGSITASLLDKELVRSTPDSLACTIAPAPGSMTGKVAFIWRGDCEFGVKAQNAENAGAIAVIIVNHSPGGPVGMGAGAVGLSVNIPAFMISLEQGTEINNRLRNGVTVKISFTTWGSGKTNDLAVLQSGIATWHAGAIPLSQINGSGASPVPYLGYDGAYMANFGNADEANVQLKSVVTFTPTTGAATEYRRDSISFASFPKADSIVAIGMNSHYDVKATSTGRFDVTYSLSSATPDEFPGDNSASYSFHVTDDVFCKGRYDALRKVPIANSYRAIGGGVDYTMGSLFYVANGNGLAAISSIFSLSRNQDDFIANANATVVIYKWEDSLFTDSLVQFGELSPIGIANHTFGTNDSGGKMYMFNYAAADGTQGINGLMLESNTWYWVGVVSPADCFIGMDGITNKLPRTYLRSYAQAPYKEFYTLQRTGTNAEIDNDILNSPNTTFNMIPFEQGSIIGQDVIDSARFANQTEGFVPAVSLRVGTTLNVNGARNNDAEVNLYPNPAVDVVNATVKLKQKASTVTYTLIDITGRSQSRITRNNIINDEVSFSTASLASGTYFLIVNTDNKSTTVRKFSIVK